MIEAISRRAAVHHQHDILAETALDDEIRFQDMIIYYRSDYDEIQASNYFSCWIIEKVQDNGELS